MKMNQKSRGGVHEQGERTSFGSHGGSPEGEGRGLPKSGVMAGVAGRRSANLQRCLRLEPWHE